MGKKKIDEMMKTLPDEVDNSGEVQPNEDSLAETPVMNTFEEVFKKELIIKPEEIVEAPQIEQSSPAKPSAVHYARRNVSALRDKVEAVLSRTYLDAVNIEQRGVFKAKPDKPIKN